MASYPALDVRSPATDILLALVDDLAPTAVEERGESTRLFFEDSNARDVAHAALGAARYAADRIDVDDEDWARRSQANLKPITVGRLTIAPPWAPTPNPQPLTSNLQPLTSNLQPLTSNLQPLVVIIQPSMGFGTGHHATTRLCLQALQTMDLENRSVLDVGTGSGVLAIAAVLLGAARAVGIDYDADAIQAANESLGLNPGVETVEFRVADLVTGGLAAADIVTANLTGASLMRFAGLLLDLLRPGGTLIVSGLLETERDDVVRALAGPPISLVWEQREDGWVALAMKRS